MTRKNFIKQIMAAGISRNTATEIADAATRAEIPLEKCLGRVLTMRNIFLWRLGNSKQAQKEFERALLTQARITPRRIRPLSKKKSGRADGLRAQFIAIDEVHKWPFDELRIVTHTNAPPTGPVALSVGTAGGGGHE